MPATKHPVFLEPDNPNVAIWRYMDFTKFVSMLENKGLFFSRADKLGDPFEGSFCRSHLAYRASLESHGFPTDHLPDFSKFYRKWTMVNCWHINEHESAAMWNLYAKTNEAIAVQSTFAKLRDCLDKDCYVGEVTYLDYEKDGFPSDNVFYPFVHKLESFKHEQEVRAITQPIPFRNIGWKVEGQMPYGQWNLDSVEPPPGGLWKNVDLNALIDLIRVAPTSPSWFRELVNQVVRRYSLDKEVIQSRLDESPIF